MWLSFGGFSLWLVAPVDVLRQYIMVGSMWQKKLFSLWMLGRKERGEKRAQEGMPTHGQKTSK